MTPADALSPEAPAVPPLVDPAALPDAWPDPDLAPAPVEPDGTVELEGPLLGTAHPRRR